MLTLPRAILPQWRYWPALPLVALFLLAVFEFGSSRPQITSQPTNAAEQQQSTNKSIDNNPSLFFKIGGWVGTHHNAIEATSTALLTVATVILGWIAYRQFTTTRAQLRAYVLATAANVEQFEPNTIPKIRVTVTNTGVTPAYEVTIRRGIIIGYFPNHADFPKLDPPLPTEQQIRATIGPGLFVYVGLPSPAFTTISASEHAAVVEGEQELFVFGEIAYRDVFRKGHHASFRLSFGRDDYERREGNMSVCPEGNDSDY